MVGVAMFAERDAICRSQYPVGSGGVRLTSEGEYATEHHANQHGSGEEEAQFEAMSACVYAVHGCPSAVGYDKARLLL